MGVSRDLDPAVLTLRIMELTGYYVCVVGKAFLQGLETER